MRKLRQRIPSSSWAGIAVKLINADVLRDKLRYSVSELEELWGTSPDFFTTLKISTRFWTQPEPAEPPRSPEPTAGAGDGSGSPAPQQGTPAVASPPQQLHTPSPLTPLQQRTPQWGAPSPLAAAGASQESDCVSDASASRGGPRPRK